MDRSGKRNTPGFLETLWDEGPSPTARDVLNWMKEAWPRSDTYPDLGTCAYVAQSIRIIRDVEHGRKTRKRNLADEKAVTAAITGAGVFLKHASSVSQQLQENIARLTIHVSGSDNQAPIIIDEGAHATLSQTFGKVEGARHALGAALDAVKSWSAKSGEIDRMIWIKRHVQEAWKRTDGSCPKSNAEHGPIVNFMCLALDAVDLRCGRSGIAKALQRIERKSSLRKSPDLQSGPGTN